MYIIHIQKEHHFYKLVNKPAGPTFHIPAECNLSQLNEMIPVLGHDSAL